MASRNQDMQDIFSRLSEKNKDIVILIARSMKVAQEKTEQPRKPSICIAESVERCSVGTIV